MNKNNAKDFLPLVQALADGKTIQYKNDLGEWGDIREVTFRSDFYNYRIKPEPIERWGVIRPSGELVALLELEESAAKYVSMFGGRYFLMREVV